MKERGRSSIRDGIHDHSLTCKAPQARPRANTLHEFIAAGMAAGSVGGRPSTQLQRKLRPQHTCKRATKACMRVCCYDVRRQQVRPET